MHPFNNIAFKAARSASKIILRAFENLGNVKITEKSANDFVTEIDQRSEQEIINTIRKAYPDHAIFAEESGAQSSINHDEHTWVIDPLDGTANYIHGLPHFSISIAVKHRDKILTGLIYDPIRQELFYAENGGGAYLNSHRIRVNAHKQLQHSFLGVGYAPGDEKRLQHYIASIRHIENFLPRIRRSGSSALDFAYVAAGRLDGIWEFNIKPWDMAAGSLLVTEAGGMISDFAGKNNYFETGDVIAGNAEIFKELQTAIQSCLG